MGTTFRNEIELQTSIILTFRYFKPIQMSTKIHLMACYLKFNNFMCLVSLCNSAAIEMYADIIRVSDGFRDCQLIDETTDIAR
jgi:hypothetical protein